MTTAPPALLSSAPRRAPSGATYARARLRLGIACVGTLVVLSTVLLSTAAPTVLLPSSTSWALTDAPWLALLVALYVGLSAPFDVLGGLLLPRRYGRPVGQRRFARAWARGAVAHGACLVGVALVLLGAGRLAGDPAALAAAFLVALGLIAAQARLAGLVGGVRREGNGLSASDPSFVGGIVGLPGLDRTMLSVAWDLETAHVQRLRRESVRRNGSRALGVALALAFDLAGLAVALFATSASATSVAGLATLSLWATLWSFLGLLALPSLSRPAVSAADLAAVRGGVDPVGLAQTLGTLDAQQEDEPQRNRVVEVVFHPVPSLNRRLRAIESGDAPDLLRPWHTARTALFLSWVSLGLLSRAVHCNCGRPELWVLFPGD